MHATKEVYPKCDLDYANSLLSGMMNAGMGAGQALGPLLGAYLYEQTDFRMTMNIIAALVFVQATLYVATAQGCQAFDKTITNF